MGNPLNEEDLIMLGYLRTHRWKIRRKRTAYDKKIRQMDKVRIHVGNQIENLGYEDLKTPIQRGYKRLFVLTEEIKYSKQADFYQSILNNINTIRYSPHRIFKEKKRKLGKWRSQSKNEQELKTPDKWVFHDKKRFTEDEKRFFYPIEYYHTPSKSYHMKYVFTEPWRFRLRIIPNIITRVQKKDSELEQLYKELDQFLNKKKNLKRLKKMKGCSTIWWEKVQNEKENIKRYKYNSLRNKPLHEIVECYNEEKEYEYTT